MDIKRACEVLSDHRHRGFTGWKSDGDLVFGASERTSSLNYLTHFEAISIARELDLLDKTKRSNELNVIACWSGDGPVHVLRSEAK